MFPPGQTGLVSNRASLRDSGKRCGGGKPPSRVAAKTGGSLLRAIGVWSRSAGGQAMRGSLGEKINQGGTADIHAWAPGQVVKLFKECFPAQLGQQEARMTRAVFAAGVP